MTKRAVFLDRDGVIVRSNIRDGRPFAPTTLDDFFILPESENVFDSLSSAGYTLIVVTNQPDVGNGLVERSVVEEMNRLLAQALPISMIKVCYHSQTESCSCRKPKPGMLLEAAKELDIDLKKSFMIGDRWSDVEAGQAAGCRSIFLNRNYNEKNAELPDHVSDSLIEAVEFILNKG